MEDMFLSAKRPFYQSSQMVILQEIEEKEYHAFASRFFKAKGSSLSYDVFHHLYSKVDGQTWYVQAILNRIYAMMPKAVTIDDVDAAVNDLVDEQEVAFENYYTSLTANQSALLRAIAKEQCVKTPMARSFIMKYRLPALSSIKTALKALVDRQLVYQYQGHYIVYDRFFGIWLRMQI
jgi:hypothetical protein